MKTDRTCPVCGKGPVSGPTATLGKVRARWHPKCFKVAQERAYGHRQSNRGDVMTTNRYNGWRNYATWNVALWLDNDQGTQEMFAERAQELLNDKFADTGQGQTTTAIEEARDEAARALADEIEAYITDSDLGGMPQLSGVYADLLQHALNDVDWQEIAEHYLADVEVQS